MINYIPKSISLASTDERSIISQETTALWQPPLDLHIIQVLGSSLAKHSRNFTQKEDSKSKDAMVQMFYIDFRENVIYDFFLPFTIFYILFYFSSLSALFNPYHLFHPSSPTYYLLAFFMIFLHFSPT